MRKSIATEYFEERRVFWILVFFVVLLIGFYLYFVSASIVNVLMREEMEIEIAAANSRISELEVTYVVEKDRITREFADEMGFVFVSNKHFVERTLGGLTVRE